MPICIETVVGQKFLVNTIYINKFSNILAVNLMQFFHHRHCFGVGLAHCPHYSLQLRSAHRQFQLLYHLADFFGKNIIVHIHFGTNGVHQLLSCIHKFPASLPLLHTDKFCQLLVGHLYLIVVQIFLDGRHLALKSREHALAILLIQPFRQFKFALVVQHFVNLQGVELASKAQRTLNGYIVVAEVITIENLGSNLVVIRVLFYKIHIGFKNCVAMLGRNRAVSGTLVLPEFLVCLRSINQLYLATAFFSLSVGQQPYICGNASIVEYVVRQLDNSVNQIVFNQIAANITFTAASIASKQRRPVVD